MSAESIDIVFDRLKRAVYYQPSRDEAIAKEMTEISRRINAYEQVVEAAKKLDDEYEKWRTGASDGTYALWSEHSLQDALYTSRLALATLDQALRLRSSDAAVGEQAVSGSAAANNSEPERAASDSHFRPDPK